MSRKTGVGGHERPNEGATNVWLTPRWIIDALGPFDLDPCAATSRPFDCATRNYVEAEDGLSKPWDGLVWMNPPYGPHLGKWFGKLIEHGNGISLTFARTETAAMQQALDAADAALFVAGRISFTREDLSKGPWTSGAPSVLLAFGVEAVGRLCRSGIAGMLFFRGLRVDRRQMQLFDNEDAA